MHSFLLVAVYDFYVVITTDDVLNLGAIQFYASDDVLRKLPDP